MLIDHIIMAREMYDGDQRFPILMSNRNRKLLESPAETLVPNGSGHVSVVLWLISLRVRVCELCA